MTATPLTARTLEEVGSRIPVPAYDRGSVTSGIVHIGVGGFHRAHMAMYVDRALARAADRGEPLEWGIIGVGLLPPDRRMAEVMAAQDCLYTLVVKDADGSMHPQVIGAIIDYVFAPEAPDAVLDAMTDPRVRIVSLTITEGGYHINQTTGAFDPDHPGIRADLEPGAVPSTAAGFVVEALARRRAAGTAPFTVLSCDNIAGNGHVAATMITAFAERKDPDLGAWIQKSVAFPNSMVDRITPVTSDADRDQLAAEFDVADQWPVVCESFEQWALEDAFGQGSSTQGRPAFEEVGVQVVEDVEPYELMKLRLLNAGHQAFCYLGYLAGHRYASEVCADPLFADFVLGYMDHEATPTLQPVPGVDLEAYKHQLIERFANPEIKDTLARLCAETSDRIPKFLVPVAREQLERGEEVRRVALVIASWARYAEGVDEQGEPIEVVDQRREQLMARAREQGDDPLAFLRDRDLFGDLADQERFTELYVHALASLHDRGALATLRAWAGAAT